MNRDQFLAEFEKHLRVGEPRRGEIIAELKTHLAELEDGADPTKQLGHPTKLARKYNQTHLGIFSSPLTIFITPFIAWSLIVYARIWAFRAEYLYNGNGPLMQLGQLLPMLLGVTIVLTLAVLVIASLARRQRPLPTVIALCLLTALIGTAFTSKVEYDSHKGFLPPELLTVSGNPLDSSPVPRDPITHEVIPLERLEEYVVPVNVAAIILKDFAYFGSLMMVFGFTAYALINKMRRQNPALLGGFETKS